MIENKNNKSAESNNKEKCCRNPNINIRNGAKVCLNCGMVIGVVLLQKERRAFTLDERRKRKRTEKRWRAYGPRTILSNEIIDSKGKIIDAKKRLKIKRLSKIQRSLTTGIERNLWEAEPKMSYLVSKLNIPDYVFKTAWTIYKSAAEKKLTMGRSIKGFIAASLYVAIRTYEIPRLLEEITDALFISRRTVIRSLGILFREILPDLNLKYKPITPEQLVFKFGNELKIPIKIQKKAVNLLRYSSNRGLSTNGKDPKGFAASAIYMAAKSTDHRKTQSQVSDTAKITEVTLRTRIKEIKELSRLN
ncbi:MAG: transcription initiation factor IIB family protein [Candidatus Hodarchaeota archaeon]